MRFAPVLPPSMARYDRGVYHLAQAHLLLGAGDLTAVTPFRRWAQSPRHYLILDNGTYELGGEPNVDALFEMARQLQPNEVVCPDVIKDSGRTIELFTRHAINCTRYASRVMIVPQGKSIEEWFACLVVLIDAVWEMGIPVSLGVPKYLEEWVPRVDLLDNLLSRGIPAEDIHLLGVYRSMHELMAVGRRCPDIRGADSTWPYAQALQGEVLTLDNLDHKYGVPADSWSPPESALTTGTLIRLTTSNIRMIRSVIDEPSMQGVSVQWPT